MKQLLVTAATSLVTGICFALGIGATILLVTILDDPPTSKPDGGEFVGMPPDLVITENERVFGVPSFTIQGLVENRGNEDWTDVRIEALVLAGGAQVNECASRLNGLLATKSRRAFKIECDGVAGSVAPDVVTYTLNINSAFRRSD